MKTNRLSLVRKRALKLYKKYSLSVPVDLQKILDEKNIILIYKENFVGIDGLTHLQESPPIIELNTEITFEARRRFTLAHEIGHICIPWHSGITVCSLDDPSYKVQGQTLINTQELEANTFASELLMPTPWIQSNFNLIDFKMKELIKKVSSKAKTSIMATLYALENALPPGHVYLVKNSAMEYWQPFKSKDSGTFNVSIVNSIYFYDSICLKKETFELSIYSIVHYQLLSCPKLETIQSIYEACNNNIEQFLNAISDFNPIRILHFINIILDNIRDKFYIVLKMGNNILRHIKSQNNSVRIFADYYDFDSIVEYVKEYYAEWGIINLNEDANLLWIKDSIQYIEPDNIIQTDPHILLKRITNDIYPSSLAHEILLRINGVVSSINSSNQTSDREELYHLIKQRFETDPQYSEIVSHELFNTYISNKVTNLLNRRKIRQSDQN